MGSIEGKCRVDVPSELVGRSLCVGWAFREKAFRRNESDQYKAAVRQRMHWICILCVFVPFEFEKESTVPVMWCWRWSLDAVWPGRADSAVHCRSTMICRGQ